jgi:uncharacterized membrane protein (UPF0182 family)
MTDPQVFYNREDLWVAPQEKYDGASIAWSRTTSS